MRTVTCASAGKLSAGSWWRGGWTTIVPGEVEVVAAAYPCAASASAYFPRPEKTTMSQPARASSRPISRHAARAPEGVVSGGR